MSVAKDSARFALTIAGLLAALLLGNAVAPVEGGHVWYTDRTFFGVYRVQTDAANHLVSLAHGTTTHGAQVAGDKNPEPLTYYHRQSPIGQLFATLGPSARSWVSSGLAQERLRRRCSLARHGVSTRSMRRWIGSRAMLGIFTIWSGVDTQCSVHPRGCSRLTLRSMERSHKRPRPRCVQFRCDSDALADDRGVVQTYRITTGTRTACLAVHISNRHIHLRSVVAETRARPPFDSAGAAESHCRHDARLHGI